MYTQCKNKGEKMREMVDGTLAYTVGLIATFSTVMWTHVNEITTIGGLIVLACRLYVDGGRALSKLRKWRRNKG